MDVAATLGENPINWPLLAAIARDRAIEAKCAIVLSFLARDCGLAIPAELIADLEHAARAAPLRYLEAVHLMRPASVDDPLREHTRRIARRIQKHRTRTQLSPRPDRLLRVSKGRADPVGEECGEAVERHVFAIPDACRGARTLDVHAEVLVELPRVRRRIEMELNTASGLHLARIRTANWMLSRRHVRLRITGTVDLPEPQTHLLLEARPARLIRNTRDKDGLRRYGALPFTPLSTSLSCAAGNKN